MIEEQKIPAKKTTKTKSAPKKDAVKQTVAKTSTKKALDVKTEVAEATMPVAMQKGTKKSSHTIDVFDITGKVVGSISLPENIFHAKVNPVLMAQAVRVYLANQRQGDASTLSRNEVSGSTRKIYRQKGTGRARHGSKKAPIFVHGGIAHGPKPKDYSLHLSKNMRQAALRSALTSRALAKEIMVIDGLSVIEPKTKIIVGALKAMNIEKGKTLLVMPEHMQTVYKAGRNIENLAITQATQLTTYQVLHHKRIMFMKEAIEALGKEIK